MNHKFTELRLVPTIAADLSDHSVNALTDPKSQGDTILKALIAESYNADNYSDYCG